MIYVSWLILVYLYVWILRYDLVIVFSWVQDFEWDYNWLLMDHALQLV